MTTNYKCGHPVPGCTAQILSGVKTNKPCPQCYRDAAVARAAIHARKHALPNLVGSPRQVMRAMTIRHEAIADIRVKSAALKVQASRSPYVPMPGVLPGQTGIFPAGPAQDVALRAEMLTGLASLHAETSADWWIANRSQSIWHWLGAIAARCHGE